MQNGQLCALMLVNRPDAKATPKADISRVVFVGASPLVTNDRAVPRPAFRWAFERPIGPLSAGEGGQVCLYRLRAGCRHEAARG
jgi:hypothetical protein